MRARSEADIANAVTTEPSDEVRGRIARLIGHAPTAFRRAERGYTPADRWLISSTTGIGAFAKVATTAETAVALRLENQVYSRLRGGFMPALIGWEDHEESPILVIEDLHDARWPPPWDRGLVAEVLSSLGDLHSSEAELKSFRSLHGDEQKGWNSVAADPEPFLALGLTSAEWLDQALPTLVAAAGEVDTAGTAVTHFDIRSDNLCRARRGVVLIDWNLACLGNPVLDLGFWLPSLEAEGGPPPEDLLSHAPEVAAFVSGFFAARAGLPTISYAPDVRRVQQDQLRTALPWAVRALGLPRLPESGDPPGGAAWHG